MRLKVNVQGACGARPRHEKDCAQGRLRRYRQVRREDHEAASGRVDRSMRGVGPMGSRRRVRRKLGRARISPRLPSRFRSDRGGGPVGSPCAHRARARAVQGEIHHGRRRRTAKGDPGDHSDQAQERRQSSVQPHQRAGFKFLFRLPQRSGRRRLGRRRRQCVRFRGVRKRAVRTRSTRRSRASGTPSR